MSILKERMKMFDCVKKGWILEGFPQTRQQALALQELGIYPKHCGQFFSPGQLLLLPHVVPTLKMLFRPLG